MRRALSLTPLAFLLATSLWLGSANAGPSALMSATALRQQLQSSDAVLVLDASPTPRYLAGHIPGAVNADYYAYGMNPGGAEAMQARLRAWGLRSDPKQRIVLYDAGGDMLAARLYFDLLSHGVAPERMALLDGGLHQWKAQGGSVEQGPAKPGPAGDIRTRAADPTLRTDLSEFVNASGQPRHTRLVEALEPEYYFGGKRMFSRGGHVPHALLLPTQELFNADKTFKAPNELARQLRHLGLKQEQTVVSYCGGGVAAAVPFFVMKALLDWPQVKLYPGSQREYLLDDRDLPLWTYAEESPLRERTWLEGWNNPMMRAFGAVHLQILDLRPAVDFERERVPGAVNLPIAEWRAHRADSAKLASLLGAVGVIPEREVVLVGAAGGLQPDTALAALLLEELGQRKVGVLRESMDEWALQGGELEKGAPKAPPRAREYRPATSRPAVRTVRAPTSAADTPQLWLATGPQAPNPGTGERWAHLPLNSLLTADGRPKPAAQLWAQLQKAGVDRYADLVLTGADVGETAVAYAVLRLMGLPQLRVLDR